MAGLASSRKPRNAPKAFALAVLRVSVPSAAEARAMLADVAEATGFLRRLRASLAPVVRPDPAAVTAVERANETRSPAQALDNLEAKVGDWRVERNACREFIAAGG